MKVLFNVGSFLSLGEEPGKFFDRVLGVFMTALLADAGVEGGVAMPSIMVVIDVTVPMATSVKALHHGDNLVDYHHIDSIAYFKALPDGWFAENLHHEPRWHRQVLGHSASADHGRRYHTPLKPIYHIFGCQLNLHGLHFCKNGLEEEFGFVVSNFESPDLRHL